MSDRMLWIGYFLFVVTAVYGVMRYKRLDNAMRIVVILLAITSISELYDFIAVKTKNVFIKDVLSDVYTIIEVVLITSFFLKINNIRNYRRKVVLSTLIWLTLSIVNIAFLQPLNVLNSDILVLESFGIITMSLYSIYRMLKNDMVQNIFLNPYFWMSVIWLVEWSCTFFFWAFLKVFYRNHWPYLYLLLDMNIMINLVANVGIMAVLFYYPKMIKPVENR